jgi:hypothetical protein
VCFYLRFSVNQRGLVQLFLLFGGIVGQIELEVSQVIRLEV